MLLRHPEAVEHARQRPRFVERTQCGTDLAEPARLGHVRGGQRFTVLEPGDEPALGLDERNDRGREPERRGPLVGDALDAAVDPEQMGVGAHDPYHVPLACDLHEHIAVRQPAIERPDNVCPAAPAGHTVENRGDVGRRPRRQTLPVSSSCSMAMSSSRLPCTFGPLNQFLADTSQ